LSTHRSNSAGGHRLFHQMRGNRTTEATVKHPLKVMIIGAGTGGLCLAHGLKSEGIAVAVFERDHSPADHQQGFRLSVSATGSAALRLPPALFDKLAASSADPSRGVTRPSAAK
jgi:glycine/D-amino acid oxidase-like deaminating enzyme